MNRFMLTITVATAAILGAQNSFAQTIVYTPPPVDNVQAQPMPLGAFIASRITDKRADKFRDWLSQSNVQGTYDTDKGYTVIAVVDKDFDSGKHPVEHYIINDRISPKLMQGKEDEFKALNGDTIHLSHTTGKSYYVDGMRINGVIKNPEGTIFVVGGAMSSFTF